MNSNTREFKKLGIYSLYCVAINLKEDKNQCNIDLFSDDEILKKVFSYVIDKQNQKQLNFKQSEEFIEEE